MIKVKNYETGEKEMVITVNMEFPIAGDSLWMTELGKQRESVFVEEMSMWIASDTEGDVIDDLCVWFKDWDTSELGLLYSDTGFQSEVNKYLKSIGIKDADVCGSEQGMQGDNWVSFDAEEVGEFIIDNY